MNFDKVINNKDLPDAKEWWEDFNETNKVTFLTTLALNFLGLGGGSFSDNVDKTKYTKKELTEADKWFNKVKQVFKEDNNTSLVSKNANQDSLPVVNEKYKYNRKW